MFGATYMVLAPEHPLVRDITTEANRAEVEAYQANAAKLDLVARQKADKTKTGVFTGAFCLNPATKEPIPVWIADYVLIEYGTGAIMAVPGHDQRDFEFAQVFGLPIPRVVAGPDDRRRHAPGRSLPRGRGPGEFGSVRRGPLARRCPGHRGLAGDEGIGRGPDQLPPPRLVHLSPAVLGPTHPNHLLRTMWTGGRP